MGWRTGESANGENSLRTERRIAGSEHSSKRCQTKAPAHKGRQVHVVDTEEEERRKKREKQTSSSGLDASNMSLTRSTSARFEGTLTAAM